MHDHLNYNLQDKRISNAIDKNKIWIWTAVNYFHSGILSWALGDRSSKTFEPLWKIVK